MPTYMNAILRRNELTGLLAWKQIYGVPTFFPYDIYCHSLMTETDRDYQPRAYMNALLRRNELTKLLAWKQSSLL